MEVGKDICGMQNFHKNGWNYKGKKGTKAVIYRFYVEDEASLDT